jgi:oligopeptide transport system permease protein
MNSMVTNKSLLRFLRNRSAMICCGLLAMLTITTIALLPFSLSWFNVQDLDRAVRAKPSLHPLTSYALYETAIEAHPLGSYLSGAAPQVHKVAGWFGYDAVGRSLLFRTSLGWMVSLAIGLGAAAIAVTIGVGWGVTAGLSGGRVDAVMMRIVDILYGLPYILFVILLKVVLEKPLVGILGGRTELAGVIILFVAIGAVGWLTMARVIRGQVLSLRDQPFIEAARASGAGQSRILFKHLLPNLVGPIVVYASLIVPQAILQESFLSFLGIGIAQPTPSLGRLAADGVEAVNAFVGFWWLIAFPCGALLITLLALNFIGDGLRDALDPKSTVATII